MTSQDIVNTYVSFFAKRGHKRIPNASLIPENDPTTLFTSSGMQPLVPYLLGEEHPQGKRLVNVQNSFRAQDIDEIGDNRHTTFFRMLGNWSLGDYFKKEQLPWFFEFLTDKKEGLGLDPKRLYVTVFEGNGQIPKDTESIEIWKELFAKVGIDAKENERIFAYGAEKNWWSRAGIPENMPAGEPGGPDSEVFYAFDVPHNPKFGKECHPNCDCGRFMEIGNSVFMQYQKQQDGSFKELPQKNVDFGGGLERLTATVSNEPDIFKIDLFAPVINAVERKANTSYSNLEHQSKIRVIADHVTAATFLILNGVTPDNKRQGYVLRRLLRRSAVKMDQLNQGTTFSSDIGHFCLVVFDTYFINNRETMEKRKLVKEVVEAEIKRFHKNIMPGFKEISKVSSVDGKMAFDLYQTYGFPLEVTKEIALEHGYKIDESVFREEFKKHQDLSRTASAGMFKGGLTDHSEQTVKGHTATHLLHQALRDVLGNHVHQTGSNITSERVRFDFNFDRKLTDEELKKVEGIVNQKISENLPVHFEIMPKEEADKIGAIGLFMDTYGDKVKIYFIGSYSTEFCGGPHVDFTGKLKKFTIRKQESLGAKYRRIYAAIE